MCCFNDFMCRIHGPISPSNLEEGSLIGFAEYDNPVLPRTQLETETEGALRFVVHAADVLLTVSPG